MARHSLIEPLRGGATVRAAGTLASMCSAWSRWRNKGDVSVIVLVTFDNFMSNSASDLIDTLLKL